MSSSEKIPSSYNLFKQLPNKMAVKREDNKHQLLKAYITKNKTQCATFPAAKQNANPKKRKEKELINGKIELPGGNI